MKKFFLVSLVKNGILGGTVVADSDAITYRTGKVTVPGEYRHLVIKYEDICEVAKGWLLVLPTVTVKLKNEEEYKFIVFFSRNRFVNFLSSMGVDG